MPAIDLNADIGEGFSFDEELMALVSSVNVCTGVHAGSLQLGYQTRLNAKLKGLRCGAHIGFPDPDSMGRHLPEQIPDEWIERVRTQIGLASAYDYFKPHGALYHWLAIEPVKAERVWDALALVEKPFMGMLGTEHENQCRSKGLHFISEGFCERAYTPTGMLVPRTEPHSMLTDIDTIVEQALSLTKCVDSICIHGDRPDCVSVASAVRSALVERGFEISP